MCDFKNRPTKDVVHYIVKRLKTLLKDDESGFRRYIDMLEILSENRELQETIKEVEKMLTQVLSLLQNRTIRGAGRAANPHSRVFSWHILKQIFKI